MAKTINKEIDIFTTLDKAKKAFDNTPSADLIYSKLYKAYYVDKSKRAIKDWPTRYELIETK